MSAKRQTEDQITKIMGSYLLRGYRLLDSHCHVCQTPLMKTKTSDEYCIFCNELNVTSVDKNINSSKGQSNESAMIEDIKDNNESQTKQQNDITIDSLNTSPIVDRDLDLKANIGRTIESVHKKINWASNRLTSCDKINDCIQIINFLKSSADLLLTLNLLNESQNT